jgi:hypothetical protein
VQTETAIRRQSAVKIKPVGGRRRIGLSLEAVGIDEYGVHEPCVAVMAYRQWLGTVPCVYVHLDNIGLPANRMTNCI